MGFIVFLAYVVFFVPLAVSVIRMIRGGDVTAKTLRRRSYAGIAGTIILTFFLILLKNYTEYLWYDNLGYGQVFLTLLYAKIKLFIGGLFVSGLIFAGAFKLASLSAVKLPDNYEDRDDSWKYFSASMEIVGIISVIILSLVMGLIATLYPQEMLMYSNQASIGTSDPVFGKDIGFYLFSLPFYEGLLGWNIALILLAFVGASFFNYFYVKRNHYIRRYADRNATENQNLALKKFAGFFLGLLFLLVAYYNWLSKYRLLVSEHDVLSGATLTDVAVRIPILNIFILISVGVAIACFLSMYFHKQASKKVVIIGLGGYWLLYLLMMYLVPTLYWHLSVKSSEFDKEKTYIEFNIKYTRQAYGLADIDEKDFPANSDIKSGFAERNKKVFTNLRLWDYRALKPTLKQLQEIRNYYEFLDVDVDRYMINGQYRQVTLSAREFNISDLPESAKTWINKCFTYTHGYGLALNPVNEFTQSGMPIFLVKNIPPVSTGDFPKITRPEIYFGEMTNDHIYVKTLSPEFDYPQAEGDSNAYTTYGGKEGIKIDSFLRKLALGLRFDGLQIFISKYLTPESSIIFRRNIGERISALVPFASLDPDPSIVVRDDGSLFWIQDCYASSQFFPYSQKMKDGTSYIRNSVKATIDAYNGTVNFYVFDETDPILKTWRKIFPGLFTPRSQMPADLVRHIRYPEKFFSVQGEIYSKYHMANPDIFYKKEALWSVAREVFKKDPQPVEPYYILTSLPGKNKEEFMIMLPFTPARKDNLIGWMSGLCDGDDYGKLVVYKLPRDKQFFGPMQIESKGEQDQVLSGKFTLWRQEGSDVIRGNLLTIPVENSILYVEPVYIKAKHSEMPQLTLIIVALDDEFAYGDTFEEALGKILKLPKSKKAVTPGQTEKVTPDLTLNKAGNLLTQYFDLMGKGMSAEAGKALDELKQLLNIESSLNK